MGPLAPLCFSLLPHLLPLPNLCSLSFYYTEPLVVSPACQARSHFLPFILYRPFFLPSALPELTWELNSAREPSCCPPPWHPSHPASVSLPVSCWFNYLYIMSVAPREQRLSYSSLYPQYLAQCIVNAWFLDSAVQNSGRGW